MSGFLKDASDYNAEQASAIDFDDAIRLTGGGSICEIYRSKWQRREVFVKRLKEEYRDKPLYLDALDKEFEVGVRLKHPSLPDYREFHRDYIIMDYIDGFTLADMIKRNDPWLAKEKNILRMLKELVAVVDYLHFNNVTHCDIKPDNIIITSNNHNLVLVDFDKSYTDFLNDTAGDPTKYGLTADEVGSIAVDFQGMARVVEKLKGSVPGFRFRRYSRFIKECRSKYVNADELKQILDYDTATNRFRYWFFGLTLILIGLIVWGCFFFFGAGESETVAQVEVKAEIRPEHPSDSSNQKSANNHIEVVTPETETGVRTRQEIHDDAKAKAQILDKIIQPSYNKLHTELDNLERLKNDETLTPEQLVDSLRRFSDIEEEYRNETFAIIRETFPDISDREAWRVLSYSAVSTAYNKRSTVVIEELGKEVERRRLQSDHLD